MTVTFDRTWWEGRRRYIWGASLRFAEISVDTLRWRWSAKFSPRCGDVPAFLGLRLGMLTVIARLGRWGAAPKPTRAPKPPGPGKGMKARR